MATFTKTLSGTANLNSKLAQQELAEKKHFAKSAPSKSQELSFGSVVKFDGKSFVVRAVKYFADKTMLVNNRTGKTYLARLCPQQKRIVSVELAPWPPFIAVNAVGSVFRINAEDRNRTGKVRAIGPFGNWQWIEVGVANNSMVFVC